jgi:predicted DNA-binding transcriptional regulator AlpA
MKKTSLPKKTTFSDDELLTYDEVAAIAKCHPSTIRRAVNLGIGPPITRLGEKIVRFRGGPYRQWLNSRTS